MDELMLKIDNVSKMYKLGQIGGTTLREEMQRKIARMRGKEDPTKKIGAKEYVPGETFMALNGVSFEVKKGERVGIIGHNGAGKSTLLKLISRVTAPTGGTISMNGRVASMLEVGTGFHGELTGRENIYMNGAILGMTKKEIDAKIEDIIDFSEVRQFIDTPVKRYSSGMYVKLAFSVAAHLDSEIMIMDEVLAVGDMAFQKKCLDKMNDVSRSEGRTILYVSHNMNTIRQLCERVVVLDHGKVVFDGDVEEAISEYMQNAKREMKSHILLHSKFQSDCKMESFEFCKKDYSILNSGENIQFSLAINSRREYQNVHLRVMAYYSDGNPVFMASTQGAGFYIVEKQNGISGVIKTDNLAPGEYCLKLALYLVNNYGMEEHLDVVDGQVYFQIKDNITVNNLEWQHKWWGHIRQGEIKIVQ